MKYLIVLLFLVNTAHAAFSDVDKAFLQTRNILANPGFELGKLGWTASGGTFSVVTSGSNLLTGGVSTTWDSNAAAQTLLSSSVTIPNGLYGRSGMAICTIMVPSGSATHTIEAFDGTSAIASQVITSSTLPQVVATYFAFPATGSIQLRISSVNANEPSITIDDCYLGEARSLTAIAPREVFSASISSADAVSNENVNWINGNCTDATGGEQTCTFNTGFFSAAPNCVATAVTDGHTANINAVSSSALTIRVFNSAGTATDGATTLTCQKSVPDSPLLTYNPALSAVSWAGYHDSDCSWSSTSTSYADPAADASCTFTEITNLNFGVVASTGAKTPGITFTPSRAGRYFVCADFLGSVASGEARYQLLDGATVISQTSSGETSATKSGMSLCGIVVTTSIASKDVKIQMGVTAGTNTLTGQTASPTVRSINWSIFQIDQSFPAPQIINSVYQAGPIALKMGTARLICTSPPSQVNDPSDMIASQTFNSSGDCTHTFTTGYFTEIYTCFIQSYDPTVGSNRTGNIHAISTTSVRVRMNTANTGAAQDHEMFMTCFGR
jgi:hypothetical protein